MYFYDGLQASAKQFIDTMCNGLFFEKTPTEAHAYLEELADIQEDGIHLRSLTEVNHLSLLLEGGGLHQLKPEDNIPSEDCCRSEQEVASLEHKTRE